MGCALSLGVRERKTQAPWQPLDVFVFVPGLRMPKSATFSDGLQDHIPTSLVDRLSKLRTGIATAGPATDGLLSPQAGLRKHKASQHGALGFNNLQVALEEYLPVLLGLTRQGGQLTSLVEYGWTNQESEHKESVLQSAQYELVSVLHTLAMVTLLQANVCLTPKPPAEGYPPKVAEGDKKTAIELLLKAAQILECAIYVVQSFADNLRHALPTDLKEGVLRALQQQALGQGVEIQLGFAVDNVKASLAVKRRLACEQVKYWEQAQENIVQQQVTYKWGEKHVLFIRWKLAEAKAAAYYFHGLILDELQDDNNHAEAVACLQASLILLKESQKACMDFSSSTPMTRILLWGSMKYLSEKIPKDVLSKTRVNREVYRHEKVPESLPTLPDFPLALKAEPFVMPPIDPAWPPENIIRAHAEVEEKQGGWT